VCFCRSLALSFTFLFVKIFFESITVEAFYRSTSSPLFNESHNYLNVNILISHATVCKRYYYVLLNTDCKLKHIRYAAIFAYIVHTFSWLSFPNMSLLREFLDPERYLFKRAEFIYINTSDRI